MVFLAAGRLFWVGTTCALLSITGCASHSEATTSTNPPPTQTLALNDDLRSASGIDRQTNIPVYPIDPRGLTDGSNDTIEVGAVTGSVSPTVNLGMKQEILSSKAALLRIAEDTGGAASLGNDFTAANFHPYSRLPRLLPMTCQRS